jgi:PAS domain S-box-containing protein
MTMKNIGVDDAANLRRQAEEKARARAALTPDPSEALSPEETRQTLHELRVHKIELEMQNEELRRMQVELDAVASRYFNLYDLAPAGYCTLSEKGLILEANLTAATLLGATRGALVNKPLTRFIFPEDQDIYYLHRKQLLETGAPQSCDLRMVKRGGTPFWTHLASILDQSTADVPLIHSVLGDITAHKESEETIERIRYQNELILNSAGEGIFGLDPQGISTFVNPAAAKMLGYEAEELIGKNGHALIHHTKIDGSPYPEEECPIYATFRKGAVSHIEEDIFWTKNGTGVPVEYTCTPILDKGRMAGAVVTFLDISRRQVAEARQQKEAGQLRERVKELHCLFSISDLFRKPGRVQDEVFQGIVDRIPPACQYPDIACARLVLENREFQTGNFRLSPWKAVVDLRINEQRKGFLEAGYLEEKDWGKGGPFLAEERHLLKEIADHTSEYIARVRAEEALRESEERFRTLFEQAAVGVAQIETTTGRFLRINQRYGDIVGYSLEEMRSFTFQEITYPEDLQEDLGNMEKLVAGKIREFSMEKRFRHKNGSLIWVDLTVSPLWAPGESPDYYIAVVQEITKRKQAEEASREERVFRQAIEDAFLAGITVVDEKGRQSYVNRAFCRMVGWEAEELVGALPPFNYWPPDQSETIASILQSHLDNQAPPGGTEMILQRRNGERFWALVLTSPVIDGQGRAKGQIGSVYDITERKRIEERVRMLSQQLLRSQEEERRRISRELHDVIGQNLSALKIAMEGPWMNRLENTPEVGQRIKEWSHILQETIQGVRDMAHTLRPSSLDQLGLIKAILQYGEEFAAKNRIEVDFQAAGIDDPALDYETRIALYRLIQEGLINISKHAAASRAVIRLVSSFPHIILRIEDNGQGFDVKKRTAAAVEEKRLGLSSMEERVTLLQGKMKIDSHPGQGTRIFIEIPYHVSTGKETDGR